MIELKSKSNFSFLRGASDPRELVARALELGLPGIAIADVNGVYGLPRAFEEARAFARQHPDSPVATSFNLITGAELTIENAPPLTLLARTRSGYAALCRLITTAHAQKEKGDARLTWPELWNGLEHPGGRDLVALPALDSRVPYGPLKESFKDRISIPLIRALDGLDSQRTQQAFELSEFFEIPIVATNEVHYATPDRRALQDCLTAIREGTTVQQAGYALFGNEERYLKSALQMRSLFKDIPSAIHRTFEIAESCSFSLSELTYTYPQELVPEGETPQSYLEKLVQEGAHRIYRGMIPHNVDQQIRHELKLIAKMNYASYFLTLYDIVDFAKQKNIICQGRGSAANSICCYCLGITAIDPVRMNLLFERFISEERGEPPDIDVDFEHERREEVLQYVYERYGRDRAGMVSAVRTYQHRSAFLEISKAVGVPVGTLSAQELEVQFDELTRKLPGPNPRPIIESLCETLEGFPRHLSIHSGGFTLSQDPIIETVPVEPARMEGRTIIQWDKNDLDTTGLLKVDLLALGFLTALHKICDLIGIDWRDIPAEDPATYEMICNAETEGTFQIESRAQRSMLPKTQPRNFYDLVVQVAIVRPGPSVGEMVHPYIRRREAERRGIQHPHPDAVFEKILGRTYGVPIFQEQVMKLAIERAGFTPGEADQLRRSLASFRSAENVNKIAERFLNGLLSNGVPPALAQELFGYLKGYAHYGFPESHAASFALITYKSAYLKYHYPAHFLCGLINSQPMGFYSVDTLIQCAKRNGVTVLPVDPQVSEWDATLEPVSKSDTSKYPAVRMGFREVQGLSRVDAERIFTARKERPFIDLRDFIQRTELPHGLLERLALADVFQCFGNDPRRTLWKSLVQDLDLPQSQSQAQFKQMSLLEVMQSELSTLRHSVRGNIMLAIRQQNRRLPKHTSRDLKFAQSKKWLTVAGAQIVFQRPPTAKGTCFITLEDEFGTIDLVIPKSIYETHRDVIRAHSILIAHGKVQIFGVGRSLRVSSLQGY